MTDHPSNPPSQEARRWAEKIHEQTDLMEHARWGKLSGGCSFCTIYAFGIDSALAAQEARHKAEMEKYREELVQISVWLPNHGGIGATVLEQVQTAVLEAESKLREATEEAARLRGLLQRALIAEQRASEALAAIRFGPAPPPADCGGEGHAGCGVCARCVAPESKLRKERDRCLGIVHSYGVGYPLGDIAAAIRSGQAQPPDKMAMGGSYKVALAAAFEAVKVLADYPPEQETPKPRWKPCGASVDSSCSHGPASAPPAHGGGD